MRALARDCQFNVGKFLIGISDLSGAKLYASRMLTLDFANERS
jgi:hypothetical protein